MKYPQWQGRTRPAPDGPVLVELALPANKDAPGLARAAFAPLRGQAGEELLERAVLLTSELVSNSVVHAGGSEVRLDVWRSNGSLVVAVSDEGPGFTAVARPATRPAADGGYGLTLVDEFADAWGNGYDGEACVWFALSPRQPPPPIDLLDLRMVVDSVKGRALIALDLDSNVTNWGAGAEALTGYPPAEMLGRPLSDLYVAAAAQAVARERADIESQGSHQTERWMRRKDGSRVWVEVALAPIFGRGGSPRGLSGLISDVTDRKRARDTNEYLISELREQAMTDELTGLPNRRRWADELTRELARSRRLGTPLAVVMLDLDGFKEFNDRHGHPAGDELLRAVARGWSEALRTTDMLARFGGDEFSITLPDCPPALALTVVARVQAATPEHVASSAGIASSDAAQTADELIARADEALYDSKRHARQVSVAVIDP